jgi:hypothetical protein
MPERTRAVFGGASLRDMFVNQMSYSAKCMAIPEEIALSASFDVARKIRSMLRNIFQPGLVPAPWAFRIAAFEAGCTDSSRLFVRRPSAQSIVVVASSRLALAATICCIMSMKRFWSVLLKSATVSR